MHFTTAQDMLKTTFDRAFTKKAGTKTGRVSMARICANKMPVHQSEAVALLLWACDYASNWKAGA